MTEGQVKALFVMLEYMSRQIVDIKKQLATHRYTDRQSLTRLRERNAQLLAEKIQLKQQLDELLKFQ